VAATPNPLAAVMAALQARTQGGQMPPGGGPAAGATPGQGGDPASDYAQQVSELKGADPGMLLRQLKTMKQMCAVLMVQNLERLPNVSGQLSKLIPQFDRVIKETMQAANVDGAVRNPIQMGAANPPQQGSQQSASF
jgi:hypothetical protein